MTARARGRRLLMLLLGAGVLVACGTATGAGGPPPSAPPGGVVITAMDLRFDRTHLDVPAGRSFTLLFENREGPPHNVRIYDDVDQPLFVGDVFGGPGSRNYEVPALPAGAHRFRCDVHPDMSGTVTAR
jgi:plastocyanin